MEKVMMSGNEAIARGVYEAGCRVAAAYPGTPSTEILENIGEHYKSDIYAQWACNEKVAFEIASGASIGGARAFCAFKHVGMNVAADPIFTMGYAGVNGGFVFVTADDPGCHSSQNEQDNRYFAPHAKIAMVEPSDSQECKDYVIAAYELSERFDTPVMVRMTTRVCHSKSIVQCGERMDVPVKPYERKPSKYAMLPGVAIRRHADREAILAEMEEYANISPLNREEGDPNGAIGIITSGISYQHAREVFGDDACYLKLGLTYPLPRKLIAGFAARFDTLYVIEENDPYLETEVKALGFPHVIGKKKIPIVGELNAQIIRSALVDASAVEICKAEAAAPARPPAMCAGCPHRGFFFAVNQNLKHVVPVGDIGCYALGLHTPLNGFDYSICMGSGISSPIGLAQALKMQNDPRKVLGMVGDSTFFHSGLNSLIDVIAADANVIACILDNSITAMTGHQQNPGTTRNLMGELSPVIDILSMVRGTGITEERIRVVDPLDLEAMKAAIRAGCEVEGPFVIITKRPCVLIKEVARLNAGKRCVIDPVKCVGCKQCMKIACPAISFQDGKASIAEGSGCIGCGLCMSMCKLDAITKVEG